MTMTLAITINVLLDAAILGLLAFAMARASRLRPHVPVSPDAATAAAGQGERPRTWRHTERVSPRREPVLD